MDQPRQKHLYNRLNDFKLMGRWMFFEKQTSRTFWEQLGTEKTKSPSLPREMVILEGPVNHILNPDSLSFQRNAPGLYKIWSSRIWITCISLKWNVEKSKHIHLKLKPLSKGMSYRNTSPKGRKGLKKLICNDSE